MGKRFHSVFVISVICQLSFAQATSALFPSVNHYLHLSHTRTAANPSMDSEVELSYFNAFDMLWLGGDLAWSTSEDEETMAHVDSVFHLDHINTLWSLGNHDYADLDRIKAYTARDTYYAYHRNGITFLVLDTQDSLSNIVGLQKDLFLNVVDTLAESSHLIVLHHKLIWMFGDPVLQAQIPYVSNAGLGESVCFSCIHENNFYRDIYPELLKLEERGIEVICIAGDIGFRTNQFEYLTPEGIQFLASGIEAGRSTNMALMFHHDMGRKELNWEYIPVSRLLEPADFAPPILHSVYISPDSIAGGEYIHIVIEAVDEVSGLNEISLEIVNPVEVQNHKVSNHIGEWTAWGDQRYSFELFIADSALAGIWNLSSLDISDSAGNILILSNQDSLLASFTVYSPLGLDDQDNLRPSIFPNPSSGILNISNIPGIVTVDVFDQAGRALGTWYPAGNQIDLTGMPDGVYLLLIHNSDKRIIYRKVLISKFFGQ